MKPCIWFCRRHGALPEGVRVCDRCEVDRLAAAANEPGQLTLLEEVARGAA